MFASSSTWVEARDPGALARRKAVRSTLAVLAGCSLCAFMGQGVEMSFAYLAAYLVTMVDAPGTLRHRGQMLAATTLSLAVFAELGGVVHTSAALLVLFALVLSFASVILGGVALSLQPLGLYILIMFMVATGMPSAPVGVHFLWSLVGGGMATVATLLLWPLRRDTSTWIVIGGLTTSLGALLCMTKERLRGGAEAEAALQPFFSDLRRALMAVMVGDAGPSRADRALYGFARLSRRVFTALAALESVRRGLVEHERAPHVLGLLEEVYDTSCAALGAIGGQLTSGRPGDQVHCDAELAALHALAPRADAAVHEACVAPDCDEDALLLALGLQRLLQALITVLDGLLTDRWPATDHLLSEPLSGEALGRDWSARLLNCLRLDSPVFGHAVRMAVAVALALGVNSAFHVEKGYWTSLTVALVMQASFADSIEVATLRGLGTLAGALAALALLWGQPHGAVLSAIELGCIFFANLSVPLGRQYVAFFVTIIVVCAVAGGGVMPARQVAEMRVETTLLGCLIVVICVATLWPRWSRDRLPRTLATALSAVGRLAAELTRDYADGAVSAQTSRRQLDAFHALDDASTTLRLALREPGARRDARSQHLDEAPELGLLLSGNRVYGILGVFIRHLGHCREPHDAALVSTFGRWVEEEMSHAARVLLGAEALARLSDSGDANRPYVDTAEGSQLLRRRLHVWLAHRARGGEDSVAVHIRLLLQLRALLWEMGRVASHVARLQDRG